MNANSVIQIDNLGKQYRLGGMRRVDDTFCDFFSRQAAQWLRGRKEQRPADHQNTDDKTFWALRNISMDVKQGEVIGIIGHNGAGKSTLLKILSRICDPTEGRVTMRGRVGSLLEVGTGFHPELSGRENIYLNGAVLGMNRREIQKKFDEIVAFSGVEKFLDTPVKRYSSGMTVRLAFSVAAHLEPEIMIVDEVLAVGDSAFKEKCLGKMGDVSRSGRTILFVSHNMGAVQQLCNRVVFLKEGRVIADGEPRQVVTKYLDDLSNRSTTVDGLEQLPRRDNLGQQVRISACRVINAVGQTTDRISFGEPCSIEVDCIGLDDLRQVTFLVGIDSFLTGRVLTSTSEESIAPVAIRRGGMVRARFTLNDLLLSPGAYSITLSLRSVKGGLDQVEHAHRLDVAAMPYPAAPAPNEKWGVVQVAANWKVETEIAGRIGKTDDIAAAA